MFFVSDRNSEVALRPVPSGPNLSYKLSILIFWAPLHFDLVKVEQSEPQIVRLVILLMVCSISSNDNGFVLCSM